MARWTAAPGGSAYYAYATNYLVDTEASIIVDVEATPAFRSQEVESTKTMIERVKDRLGLDTKKLIGDTAYGTAEFLGWMVNEKGIEPHVPVWDKGKRTDGTFSRSDFIFDEDNDQYICPNGKLLKRHRRNFKVPHTSVTKSNEIKYRASIFDCAACPLKEQCCPNVELRKVVRSIHESAHMKRILKMDRLRLRGISGARDEFILTATAQNLRRMAKYLSAGPPGICATVPI